jgi:hypothetical protein
MATREQLHKEVDAVPDDQLEHAQVVVLESNGAGAGAVVKAKKRRRLSFSGIGTGDPSDASERVDEFFGLAIDKRHPRS